MKRGLTCILLVACGGNDPAPADTDDTSTGSSSTLGESSSSATLTTTTTGPDESSTSVADTSSTTADDTSSSSSGDTGEVVLHGACELADRVGGFVLLREESYSTFSGAVADGVVPVSVLENVGEEGDCRMLRRNNPFCDPACGPGETCDFDGTCLDYPRNHDVGMVDVTGLLDAVSVAPIEPTYDYFDTSLPHPAWDPLAPIELSAAGGDYEAFMLAGVGVSMIVPDPAPLVLDPDADLTVMWTPDEGPQQVRVELTIDLHGATPSKLVCVTADDGELTVDQTLVAQFVALGVTGFPTVTFHRETVDSIDITPGCVELGVRSYAEGELSVVGHTPCTMDRDCPDPMICDMPNETCVDP
ncbi:MAG TPA: hypothetical protein VG755_44290 [Nannocystaceae bacterium]|nr:hypothetical protein [Nannocystaceae bacterium]